MSRYACFEQGNNLSPHYYLHLSVEYHKVGDGRQRDI